VVAAFSAITLRCASKFWYFLRPFGMNGKNILY